MLIDLRGTNLPGSKVGVYISPLYISRGGWWHHVSQTLWLHRRSECRWWVKVNEPLSNAKLTVKEEFIANLQSYKLYQVDRYWTSWWCFHMLLCLRVNEWIKFCLNAYTSHSSLVQMLVVYRFVTKYSRIQGIDLEHFIIFMINSI